MVVISDLSEDGVFIKSCPTSEVQNFRNSNILTQNSVRGHKHLHRLHSIFVHFDVEQFVMQCVQ